MGTMKLIVPEATTNLLRDPSFALADPDTEWSISGDGAPDFTRRVVESYYGWSCALADVGGGTYAYISQAITVTATSYTLSAFVKRTGAAGVPTNSHTQAIWNNGTTDWESIKSVGGGWYLCRKSGTPTAGARHFGVRANEDLLRVDAVQLENKAYRTTFCDGTQEGCAWNGAPNASTSTRSAMSRAGGRVRDFEDDYGFIVTDWQGWGVPPHTLHVDNYASQPGGALNSARRQVNVLTLVGHFKGDTMAELHSYRQALAAEVAHDRYPKTEAGWQPVRLRYEGAAVQKEAQAFYDSGLGGSNLKDMNFTEKIPVRFLMVDPLWYQLGESARLLDTNDSATTRYVAGRLRSTGQWDDLGLTANPTGNGTIYAIAYNPHDGLVYVAGNFTGMNNVAGRDYIASYNPVTDTWASLAAANAPAATIRAIAIAPNGDVYIGGAFTNVGGAAGDAVAYYDISAGAWAPLAAGAPVGAIVYALAFDHDGDLFIAHDQLAWNADGNQDYITKWDGTLYSALGTGMNGTVNSIAVGVDNTLYAGGAFTTAGGVAATTIAQWDGSSWGPLGLGFNGTVQSVAVHPQSGELYAGGNFTTSFGGAATYNYVARWTGTEWRALGAGVNGDVYRLAFGPDGLLYVSGAFTLVIDYKLAYPGLAIWNGSAWANPDINLPGVPTIYAIHCCRPDLVLPQHYDIYIGWDTTGAAYFSGTATATNDGTAAQYPQIIIRGSGGADVILTAIRNETAGQTLYCNYNLLDGETLTIDCRPGKKKIISSMFGERPDAILPNSDFGSFTLQPGDNQITCFVDVVGAPTITAYLLWRDTYLGVD